MSRAKIDIPAESITAFCKRWRVREFSLFGSVLSDSFRQDSDIDVLVSMDENPSSGLFEMVDMIDELKSILGREVDLVEKEAIRNPFRRHSILSNREILYAA